VIYKSLRHHLLLETKPEKRKRKITLTIRTRIEYLREGHGLTSTINSRVGEANVEGCIDPTRWTEKLWREREAESVSIEKE